MKVISALPYLVAILLADASLCVILTDLNELCEHSVYPSVEGSDPTIATSELSHEIMSKHFKTAVLVDNTHVYINNPFPGKCHATVKLDDQVLEPMAGTSIDITHPNEIDRADDPGQLFLVAHLKTTFNLNPNAHIKVQYYMDDHLLKTLAEGTNNNIRLSTNSFERSRSQSLSGATRAHIDVRNDASSEAHHSERNDLGSENPYHLDQELPPPNRKDSPSSSSSSQRSADFLDDYEVSEEEEGDTQRLLPFGGRSQGEPSKKKKNWARKLLNGNSKEKKINGVKYSSLPDPENS